jgi:hypothetical protein
MREPRGRRAGERVSGIPGGSALVFGLCEDGTLQMDDRQTKVLSFPVLGATSEKFILAIVLLDALLNGQGHGRPILALPMARPLYT